jgi:hypothetical protein
MFSHEALGTLTRNSWLVRLSTPFELNAPRVTVPGIQSACASNKTGRALAAAILLAAGDAVQVTKVAAIQDQLRDLTSENVKKTNPSNTTSG